MTASISPVARSRAPSDSITADCNDIRALCTNISFFTNALDMESEGVDVVLTSVLDWSPAVSTDFSFAFSYNEIDITGQSEINGQQPVSAADVEDMKTATRTSVLSSAR